MSLSRRLFISSAAVAPTVFLPASAALAPKHWDTECAVLVIGGGAAGMSAAVSAAEAGAGKVILLEKNVTLFQNSTTYSNGLFSAANTKAQVRQGVKDPGAEVFAQEIMKSGHGFNDKHLVEIFAHNSGETINWLEDKGIHFKLVPNPAFGVLRMHHNGTESGGIYIEVLSKEAKRLGVDIMLNTKALELVTNDNASAVIGVVASSKGKTINIKVTKGVIICSGGFMGSASMIDKYLLPFRGAVSCASPASTGDGLLMAQKIGADTFLLDQGAVYCYGVPVDLSKRRGLIFRGNVFGVYGSIAVGDNGKRFVADELGSAGAGKIAAQHGFKHTYILATEAQLQDFMAHDKSQVIGWSQDKFKEELKNPNGFAKKADTIPELASKLGLDPKTLEETISRYNGFVKKNHDDDFNRKCIKGDFQKGPFYGFICQPVAMANLGGLHAGKTMEIVDVYNKPIKHLYAAGEAIGGVHGDSYAGGDSIGASITIGRYLGKLVAKNKSI